MPKIFSQPYFNLIAPTNTVVEIYLDRPSQFILDNQQRLLPTWNEPVRQVILVLQQSRLPLVRSDEAVAEEKDLLRERFLRFGCSVIFWLRDWAQPTANLVSDLFDPRSGYPFISRPGDMTLSDPALVKALLQFPLTAYGDCTLITHPQWGSALYPATIVSSASKEVVIEAIEKAISVVKWQHC